LLDKADREMIAEKRGWIAITDGLDKDELLRSGFPYRAVVECAVSFIIDRPDKGFGTFDFCMGVWIGWRITDRSIKESAWKEAVRLLAMEG